MRRTREPLDGTFEYKSTAEFLATPPRPGAHAVQIKGQWLDLYYEDHGKKATLISFHAATPRSITTLPVVSGRAIAKRAGMNFLTVSDPTLSMGDIDIAWFAGNHVTGPLYRVLTRLLKHLLGDRRAVLFGPSGGGYAAVRYAKRFSGHIVLAVNPRLRMDGAPEPKMERYLRVAHEGASESQKKRIRKKYFVEDLSKLYRRGLPFDLHLVQNQEDLVFRHNQAEPFVNALQDDKKLHYFKEAFGEGHRPIPKPLLIEHLENIKNQYDL